MCEKGSVMVNKKLYFNKKPFKIVVVSTTLISFLFLALIAPVCATEAPEYTYYGIDNASVILKNIDFNDVKISNTWAREAICETAALDIVKGYGDKTFRRTNYITKEQAIALIYRAAGMEAQAQLAAEALDNVRALQDKKTYAPAMWSDGYLQLAANGGLISAQDLADALTSEPDTLTETSFYRGAFAQRQEVAYWLAQTLGFLPVYGQQKIFNSFNDWTLADPHKVPYIEAVLANNIMNGESEGYFRPTGYITREQMAQVIKNALPLIFPLLGYEKKIGTVEDIQISGGYPDGVKTVAKTYNVRNSNGKLHAIITNTVDNRFEGYKNERTGSTINEPDIDLIVYKGNWVGNRNLLKIGDRIEYTVDMNGRVIYVKVLSNVSDIVYIVARINKVNPDNLTLNVSKIFNIDYPNMDVESRNFSFDMSGENVDITFVYSNNAEVFIDGKRSDVESINPVIDAILAIRDNIVVGVKNVELRLKDKGVVSGIVEDNNPQLGYITLYNEKGMNAGGQPQDSFEQLQTYNYLNPKDIGILKNGKKAGIEDVEGGDSVYLKLDDKGNIEVISAVDNYIVKFGKVISKRPLTLSVRYDDGTYQVLDANRDINVIFDRKVAGYEDLKDGDRVKLLLNITDSFTKLKQITIEGDEHFITSIYKGTVAGIDNISGKLILQNLEVLKNGKWVRTEQKGFTTMSVSEDNTMYSNSGRIDEQTANKFLKDNEAYIAVEKDYGGNERAVIVSFRNAKDSEAPVFDDSIASNSMGIKGEFSIEKEYKNLGYNEGTIIIKDSRLVSGNSIVEKDQAYIVANRSYDNGNYYASVVEINERSDPDFIRIYRGRISDINENSDFTVESFSELKGLEWEYYNTPKTFKINYDTRVLDDNGVVGQRDFTDYDDSDFVDRPVYILADGINAVLINTAPYGNINAKGEIIEIIGENIVEDTAEQEATGQEMMTEVKLVNARIYDIAAHMWVDSDDIILNILRNSIVLKNNKVAEPSELEKGDSIRVIKRDNTAAGDAYIIFAE